MNKEEILKLERYLANITETGTLRLIIKNLIIDKESYKFIINCSDEWDKFFSLKKGE